MRGFRALSEPAELFPDSQDVATWVPPLLASASPLAVLEDVAGDGAIALDVTLLDAFGAVDVAIDGVLDVQEDVQRLVAGPVGVQTRGAQTRALEAHLSYEGGRIAVPALRVAIAKDAGFFDVVDASLDRLPNALSLLTAVGGGEIQLPGEGLNGTGVAVLLTHSGEARPEVGVRFRDDALNAALASPRTWHVDATLEDVPEAVWLVAGGAKPGDASGLGCLGIAIPSPTLEYAATDGGLGLALEMEGGLLTGLLSGTLLGATIGSLPTRASIAALDGGNLLTIRAPSGGSIRDIRVDIDAEVRLRVDCTVDVGAGPFSLEAGIQLDGPGDRHDAVLGVGTVSIVLGNISNLTLDFGDLGELFRLGFALDGFPLRIDIDQAYAALQVRAYARGCFTGSVGSGDAKVTETFCRGPSVNVTIDPRLETTYWRRGGRTELGSATIASCGFRGGLDVGRVGSASSADFGLVLPGLPGIDGKALAGVAQLYDILFRGRGVGDSFYLSGPSCGP